MLYLLIPIFVISTAITVNVCAWFSRINSSSSVDISDFCFTCTSASQPTINCRKMRGRGRGPNMQIGLFHQNHGVTLKILFTNGTLSKIEKFTRCRIYKLYIDYVSQCNEQLVSRHRVLLALPTLNLRSYNFQ